jgi:PAS domain S-box-containing protein
MQKKALVVDNDYFFVEFLTDLLEKRGYQVFKAYNGKQGIALLEDKTVDILFSDLILQKVDGRQLFKFVRDKFNGSRFPLVALSGSMIEQLGSLQEIGADYYIAKGPVEELSVKLNEFLTSLETLNHRPPAEPEVLAAGNVFPRRDAMELMTSLKFHQAVIECAGAGILVVDDDTRIINANPAALEMVGKSFLDILNRPVADLFAAEERSELIDGLKQVRRQEDTKKITFYARFHSRLISATLSTITVQNNVAGWVVVLVPSLTIDPNTAPA